MTAKTWRRRRTVDELDPVPVVENSCNNSPTARNGATNHLRHTEKCGRSVAINALLFGRYRLFHRVGVRFSLSLVADNLR